VRIPRREVLGKMALQHGPAPGLTPWLLGGLTAALAASLLRVAASPGSESAPVPAQDRSYQVPYNGKFTFTRLRYGSRGGFGFGGGSWNHDYPAADRNMQFILDEYTALETNTEGSNVVDLEDPRIFESPILYMSEPGYWPSISEEGAKNLRDHLLKGGFLIFDDFEVDQWDNMAEKMRQVLPEAEWIEIGEGHPIFRAFFNVENIRVPHPLVRVTPIYQAIFEDNDPTKRMMVLANHNSDLAEYWEWAPDNFFPVDPTNEAFRLGVNYIVYAMNH
jgi:hypothetical protein